MKQAEVLSKKEPIVYIFVKLPITQEVTSTLAVIDHIVDYLGHSPSG